MEENIGTEFYEILKDCTNPGVELVKFYGKLFSIKPNFRKVTPLIGKLVRLYGRKTVFLALTDMYFVRDIKHENIFPLVKYLCKKRFEADSTYYADDSLQKMFGEYEKSVRKIKKQKLEIRSPFDE